MVSLSQLVLYLHFKCNTATTMTMRLHLQYKLPSIWFISDVCKRTSLLVVSQTCHVNRKTRESSPHDIFSTLNICGHLLTPKHELLKSILNFHVHQSIIRFWSLRPLLVELSLSLFSLIWINPEVEACKASDPDF